MVYCFATYVPELKKAWTEAPPSVAAPVALTNDAVVGLMATWKNAPDENARLPLTVAEVPGVPLPGAKMPPLAMVVLPTIPVPVSVPALTVRLVAADKSPVTLSVPPERVHALFWPYVPLAVQLPPTTLKVEKPRYCWAEPIEPR